MLVQLFHGQATAKVAHGRNGFTITSSLVNVVDQGTQFGVSVEKGRADVVVFDGKVDVQAKLGIGTQKRLTQGDAVKIDDQGRLIGSLTSAAMSMADGGVAIARTQPETSLRE